MGARYHYVLLGALSTRSYLKRQNFACEALLEKYAEPLVAVASAKGYRDKQSLTDEAWRMLMINSAHDSIHGSSVDEVHVEMEARFASARQIAAGLIHDSMSHLCGSVNAWWLSSGGRGALSYAPTGCESAQPCEVWLALDGDEYVMKNAEGEELPTQVLPREVIEKNGVGLDRNDPFPHPLFRKVLYLDSFRNAGSFSSAAAFKGASGFGLLDAGDDYIDNGLVRVSARDACIDVYDYATGRCFHSLNMLEEDADAGDAWDFSPPWILGETVRTSRFSSRLTERGPVRCSLEMRGVMNVPAKLEGDIRSEKRAEIEIVFTVSVYRGTRRVDVKARIGNTAKDHRIRLLIPPRLQTKEIISQGHLAIMRRGVKPLETAEKWRQPPTLFYPCREWIAAADESAGLAVAMKGMYDYECIVNPLTDEPELRVTLLRCVGKMGRLNTLQRKGPASDANDTPGAQCLGTHEFEWAYIPYEPDPTDIAPFLPLADCFLYPPVAHAVRREEECLAEKARVETAYTVEPSNLRVSAFKKCLNGDGYALRFFENQGKPVKARISFNGFTDARMSNMDEETLDECQTLPDGSIEIDVGAYKAVTLKVKATD